MTFHALVYDKYEYLHPVSELSRGRFGTGVLVVYDTKKCDKVVAKRVSKRCEESFDRQVSLHIRASSHVSVATFMGILPSSNSCHQYALEFVPEGNLRQLVASGVGLPDVASKTIFQQLLHCLDYLHQELGIVHGGVRPDHVLLASTNRCIVKLCNFSCAHPIGSLVKMNRNEGSVSAIPWKKRLNRLKTFFTQRTSSLRLHASSTKVTSAETRTNCAMSMRLRKSNFNEFQVNGHAGTTNRRQSSVSLIKTGSISKLFKEVGVHEYTVDDYLQEIDSDKFSQAFTAPELVNATRYVASPAADNWSLIILAIYCVTGSTPWESAGVDNKKYTAFLHSSERSTSLTPNLNDRLKDQHVGLLKIRSRSLTSLFESIKRLTSSDRLFSSVFEAKVSDILKQPANKRVTLRFSNDFYNRKWSDDSVKWEHYPKCFFDKDWMECLFSKKDDGGELKSKKRKDDSDGVRKSFFDKKKLSDDKISC